MTPRNLKIGLVTGEFPPMQGGVGAFSEKLAKALSSAGHEVHIVTSTDARPLGERRSIWDVKEPYDIEYASLHPKGRRWWWSSLSAIADVAVRYDLDLVNLQYQAAAFNMHIPAINFLPTRLQGVAKTIVTFHDLRTPYLFPKAGKLRQKVVGYLANSADGIVVTNGEDYQIL